MAELSARDSPSGRDHVHLQTIRGSARFIQLDLFPYSPKFQNIAASCVAVMRIHNHHNLRL